MKLSTGMLGDVLIAFGTLPASLPARFADSPWAAADSGEGWQLFCCAPCADWRGTPLTRLEQDGWLVFSLGEFAPAAHSAIDEAELTRQVAAFHGRALVLAWDAHQRHWHAWTDRFGTLHAYRADGVLSTFSPAAAAFTPRSLDWVALAGFFACGFFPGERTQLEGLSILRPSTHTVLDSRGNLLRQERIVAWQHAPDTRRTYDETVNAFGRIFLEVMADALKGSPVALPLSGGLDSRSTAAAITPSLAANAWAYSYGYTADSVETRIARQVAAARGLPFQAFTIAPYLFENLERLLAWTEGFQDVTQARQAAVRDALALRGGSLVGALWGDVWLDNMGLGEGQVSPAEAAAFALGKMLKRGRTWLLQHVVGSHLTGGECDVALEAWVRQELFALQGIAEADFRVKAFKTEQWSFRWSLPPVRVFQSAAWPRLVFYDGRLADFFATVPAGFLSGRRLQIDFLKRFAPDLARITWQVYDANLYDVQHFNTWQLPKRALKKAWRLARGKQVLERNWEVQFLHPAGRAGLERWLLRPGLRLHQLVAPGEVAALLNSFFAAPDAANGYTVSMLLTFSAWLEQYG